ncbi:Putative N-acetylgalactosaminyl-diphosphoundecaprenol glucuronosyltransferase [Arcticibacter svalbardensis MN12-7]|uniref:Putative N-acetylgalactosaminyl-diphosphoundecaprenol glucuronosyltransferase n=2 Tax=Arcticibacter TaxID=1288026 RepID=R9GQN7_9SPHI|nr:Putative N-acetylgalactosaminyl-diphosphoundecaprenol glucuronosyltransferase [Arcticibacter svalbardensis MN12-7]
MYNAEKYVGATIESVIKQTYPNWEMIIVDDGSKDGGADIVSGYASKDPRIKLVHQKNGGSAAARNNGIRRAAGQYIALLDADDLWFPNFLEAQLNFMEKTNSLLVYSSHTRIDENSKEILEPFIVPKIVDYHDLLKSCAISCLTGLYNIEPYGKVYLREAFKSLRDDYIYWLEIIKKVKVAYGNTEVLAQYRVLQNSVSRNKTNVIKPQFMVYYKVEQLGLLKSVYYLSQWAIFGYRKYRK